MEGVRQACKAFGDHVAAIVGDDDDRKLDAIALFRRRLHSTVAFFL